MKKKESAKSQSSPKSAPKKSSASGNGRKKDFLVVGLGASAGGIKALQDFFATMPPNSGMAFVVILHLSPEHESNLPEIIQSRTAMPVTLVSETHEVEPNRVYVIPPNKQLEMVDGVVRCKQLTGERGTRVAIDVFFRTLAETYERNAVCVVMSGTGTDGTIGLKAVKEANGFAIVQAPEDAQHDGMPRSAIATQLVDWVLPVTKMPEKLIQFRNSSERLHLTMKDSDGDGKVARKINADESLRDILTVLRVRTGHDFSTYKTPTLVRRIARHLQIHDLEDIPSYLEFLRENPDEIQSLLKNLLINVTNFFRDRDAWEVMQHEVVPNLFAGKRSSDTVRVWCCACASGEEAYTLGMILTEYAYNLSDPPKIQIFATDVDEDAIAEGREHRYPQTIEADVSPERLKRFFVKEGKYYRVKKELREMILFAPHNVLRDPPFSRLDLITCRNLLIYLNRETQERVMDIFHFALVSGGYLMLGSSESAESASMLFAPVDKKQRIYTRRPMHISQPNVLPRMPLAGRWDVKMPEYKTKKRDIAFSLGEIHYKLLEKFATPSVLVNQDFDIQYLSESAGRYLHFKGGEPSDNLLKLVHADLLPDLRGALFTAQREQRTVEFKDIRALIDGVETSVDIIVRNVEINDESSDYLLVVFDEHERFDSPKEKENTRQERLDQKDGATESVVLRLEADLLRTKENLRSTIEQHEVSVEELKASNEELQAINEELRSTTEELETSKEELQSVNEELTTVNQELKEKIDEATRTNSDLQNLMASTDIATIFLDRNLRIKRLTTPVEQIFNITRLDIGRPLEHFTHRLKYENLVEDATTVLDKLTTIERETTDGSNRIYLTRFVPYRTVDDRIEGVVLNFIDITERKKSEEALRESETRLRMMMESVADYAIIFTDMEGIITSWNAGAEKIFGWEEKEAVGRATDFIFLPEDIRSGVPYQERQTAMQKGRAEDERFHMHKNGSQFYVSGVMTPLRDGEESGFVKICRDQTERLKAETAMRDKEMLTQLVTTQEDERRRIAREIHDHLGQQLTVLRFKLEQVRKMCEDQQICEEIEEAQAISEKLDREADFLAWELRPAALDDLGLRVTMNNFVREWSRHTQINAEFHATGLVKTRLPFETETNLYRIAQEALNNIYKHAKAKNVSVLLEKRKDTVLLIIEDDGVGFNVNDKNNRTKGMGLIGMNERAKICGGEMEIESSKGSGTTVFARVPAKLK
jgi:two-component system, chemotaxis family, CheB/CheR fusion protein